MSRSTLSVAVVVAFILLLATAAALLRRGSPDSPEPETPIATASPSHHPAAFRNDALALPVKYSIGQVDPRFGVREATLLGCVSEAARIWESAAQRRLFEYDPSSPFKVNLVFDERQTHRNEQRKLKSQIDNRGYSFDLLKKRYDDELRLKADLQQNLESDMRAFEPRLQAFNIRAESWNSRGGAPPDEMARLQDEKLYLEQANAAIERKRQTLNITITELNNLADAINEIIARNNLDVRNYNGVYSESREFEKGTFDGSAINIYELEGEADLRLVLVHELGHALGFDHVDDPDAIMFFKIERQDTNNIHLARADLELLGNLKPG